MNFFIGFLFYVLLGVYLAGLHEKRRGQSLREIYEYKTRREGREANLSEIYSFIIIMILASPIVVGIWIISNIIRGYNHDT